MSNSFPKHIVVCPVHLWGHARPLAILAARLVKLGSVVVTIAVAAKYLDGVKAEATRDFQPDEKDAAARLRFLSIEQGPDPLDPSEYEKNFLATWTTRSLGEGHSVTAQSLDGTRHELDFRSTPPSALILDLFAVHTFNALREERNRRAASFKIYTWVPIATDSVLTLFRKDMIAEAESAAALCGTSFDEEAHKLIWAPSGKLLKSPCLPDMYDYEIGPQGLQVPPWFSGRIFIRMARVLHETDGVVTFDAAEYHPEAAAAFRKWFAETGRSVYFSGPLVPPVRPSVERTADLLAFLDRQLASRGERSVIYISFGSLFWPSDPAKFAAVLGVLMGRNIPFVLTRPSPFTSFPDHTKAALATYDKAYIADWVPQQAVLHHAATGWCLTHGGHNSVLECILAEVPMILWPVVVDQPTNAIYLAELVGVAYELIEVRHGSGLGTIYRTGRTPSGTLEAVKTEFGDVLDRAFGEDGEEKRLRLRTFKRTLEKAWMEDGVTRREVQDFVSSIV